MHTTVEKSPAKPWQFFTDEDGNAWTVKYPEGYPNVGEWKYRATIPDIRLDHSTFQCTGFYYAWAGTLEELIKDIKTFDVPEYSKNARFFRSLIRRDKEDTRDDRQVDLYLDQRGAKVTRGEYTLKNMTPYTSL